MSTKTIVRRARGAGWLAAVATVGVLLSGCAGSGASPAPGATPTSAPARRPAAATTPEPPTSAPAPAPAPASPVCAQVAGLYAELVAGPLGLSDDADLADRQALGSATEALRARVPAAVAHDLDVLAQAYGAAARALDDAGQRPDQLQQAVTAVTEPAVTDAAHDLDRYLQAHCA